MATPLLGAWEANIDHAVTRSPIDVCSTREEDEIVLGNLGVVRVDELGPGCERSNLAPGDVCMLMPFGVTDRHGFAELVHAYDCPGTLGLLARETHLPAELLLPIPPGTRHTLEQWATYGRLFTALDLWRRAQTILQLQAPDHDPSQELIFAWGGGVALIFLQIAQQHGYRTAMTASSDVRLELITSLGITPVDRRAFPHLNVPRRTSSQPGAHARHQESRRAFLAAVAELSDGSGAAIVLDNIGEALYPVTLGALAREGVLATCGWKAGMRVSHLRGSECIQRHVHLHTHVWHRHSSAAMRDWFEAGNLVPPSHAISVVNFDEIGRMARTSVEQGLPDYFTLYRNELA
ncbi:hypothetical protein [Luteococcus sp.]|uniref:hypothetical protein n=1 Tax=Luteococcus sp. TaxID=1969402 RepID=UPI003735FA4D